MAKYQVLHVSRYDFKDAETNKQITGCKVTVLGDTDTSPNSRGRQVLKFSAPIAIWDRFSNVPGEYELDLVPRMNGNSVKLELKDASMVAK